MSRACTWPSAGARHRTPGECTRGTCARHSRPSSSSGWCRPGPAAPRRAARGRAEQVRRTRRVRRRHGPTDHVAHFAAARIAAARPWQSYIWSRCRWRRSFLSGGAVALDPAAGTVTAGHALVTIAIADWLPVRVSPRSARRPGCLRRSPSADGRRGPPSRSTAGHRALATREPAQARRRRRLGDDRLRGRALAGDADRAAAVGPGVAGSRPSAWRCRPRSHPGRRRPTGTAARRRSARAAGSAPSRAAQLRRCRSSTTNCLSNAWRPRRPAAARRAVQRRPEPGRPGGPPDAESARTARAEPASAKAAGAASRAAERRRWRGRRPGRCELVAWPSVSVAHTAGAGEQRGQGNRDQPRRTRGRSARASATTPMTAPAMASGRPQASEPFSVPSTTSSVTAPASERERGRDLAGAGAPTGPGRLRRRSAPP